MATSLRQNFWAILGLPALFFTGFGVPLCTAQTINWSSLTDSTIVDSNGSPLDPTPGSVLFTLGAFDAGFDPLASNIAEWGSRWHELDTADYSYTPAGGGYFTSTISLQTIPKATYTSLFEGKTAYVWVYNTAKDEQFLSTAMVTWTLPQYDDTCCANGEVITYSLSDLGMTAPVVGSQNGVTGGGQINNPGTFDLQTALIPESSTATLLLLTLAAASRRRR